VDRLAFSAASTMVPKITGKMYNDLLAAWPPCCVPGLT